MNSRKTADALVRVRPIRVLGIGAFVVAALFGIPAQADQVTNHWTMPPVAIPEAARPAWPNIFGTVALPVRARQTSTRWTKLMRASLDQPDLLRLASHALGLSELQQVAYVQSAVSQALLTRTNSHDCADDGYWAAASETLNRGFGDCFDIAIAKMEALRSLGFANNDLYLTTGYLHSSSESGRGRGTAALLVRVGDGFLLLSDASDSVIETNGDLRLPSEFNPYITYGQGMTWVHGRKIERLSSAASETEGRW